jgi:hypothetical protein
MTCKTITAYEAATTHTFTHYLNTRHPLINVYIASTDNGVHDTLYSTQTGQVLIVDENVVTINLWAPMTCTVTFMYDVIA